MVVPSVQKTDGCPDSRSIENQTPPESAKTAVTGRAVVIFRHSSGTKSAPESRPQARPSSVAAQIIESSADMAATGMLRS